MTVSPTMSGVALPSLWHTNGVIGSGLGASASAGAGAGGAAGGGALGAGLAALSLVTGKEGEDMDRDDAGSESTASTAVEKRPGELRGAIISGFQLATQSGPLCGEPMWGVCLVVEGVESVRGACKRVASSRTANHHDDGLWWTCCPARAGLPSCTPGSLWFLLTLSVR